MQVKALAKAILPILLLTISTFHCYAQERQEVSAELLPIIRGLKWGYINKTGRVVVRPQFDWARDFSEGMARFEVGERHGFIDGSGRIVIKPQFIGANDFSDGLAAVKIPDGTCELCGEWVYINKSGEVVIHTKPIVGQSNYVSDFSEGLASFYLEDKTKDFTLILPYGYIDKTGKVVIQPKFGYAGEFHGGLAVVAKDFMRTGWGYINQKGDYVIEPKFSNAGDFQEGLAHVQINGKWGFIDRTGKVVIAPEFDDVWPFSEGYALVQVKNRFGYIDKTGRFVIAPQFEWSWNFSEGLAPAKVGNKIGYINKQGKFAIPPQFETVEYEGFSNGIARVFEAYKVNYPLKIGYIDTRGKFIWKPTV